MADTRQRSSRKSSRRDSKSPAPGPRRREPAAKVEPKAAARIRAGHPWVFTDALDRGADALETGRVMPVTDGDGHRLGWGVVDKSGAIALRMLGHSPELDWGEEEVARRLERALSFRARFESELPPTRRLVHGESEGLPGCAVDCYGDWLVVYRYSACTVGYMEWLLDALMEQVKPAGIYLQDRTQGVRAEDKRGGAELVRGRAASVDLEVEEDGLKFLVDPSSPVSPGLFLDLRRGRRLFEAHCKEARVLNLFSFTGAFTLRGVRGGAASVTSIDAAARSHARCRQNLAASELDPEASENLAGDVFKYLERFRQRGRAFDLVVVDPPPFSNVKGSVFSALRDWSQLVEATAESLAPGAKMLAVSNAAALTEEEFLRALGEGCRAAKRDAWLIDECGLPPDFPVLPAFPEGKYLKVKLLQLD